MSKFSGFLLAAVLSMGAQAEIALIVHPSNNAELDADYFQKIYTGKLASLPDGEAVLAYNFDESNPLRQQFDEKVLRRQTQQIQALWAKLVFTGKGTPPTVVADPAEVIKAVAADVTAIGYVDASAVDASVKVIAKF